MRSFDSDPVEVRLEACYCPGSPHEADLVYLAPSLSMQGGMASKAAIAAGLDDSLTPNERAIRVQELLAEVFMRHGVVAWNLTDERGEALPLTFANIAAALPYGKGGRLVADRADGLYAEDILSPLVATFGSSSQRGRTNGSTSATRTSTRRPRSRS
jgi:hypothetical protein